MKSIRYQLGAVCISSLAFLFVAGCGSNDDPAVSDTDLGEALDLFAPGGVGQADAMEFSPDQVILRVDGTDVTQGELMNEVNMLMARMQGRVPPEQMAQMQEELTQGALENLIIKRLLLNKVESENVEIDQADVDQQIAMYRSQIPPGQSLEEQLTQIGMSLDVFEDNVRRELRVNKLLEDQVSHIPAPTEEEIAAFHSEHETEYFAQPESVRASHILVTSQAGDDAEEREAARARLESIREQLLAGADFAELAQSESECPSSMQGGSLGTFTRGQMVPPFEDAAFSQPIGEIGEIVETNFGYHLIKVEERFAAGTQSLDDARDQIAQYLTAQAREEALRDYIMKLRTEAQIEFVQ